MDNDVLKKYKRKDTFNALWQSLPPYLESTVPNEEFSRVSQWQVKEMRKLVKIVLPVLNASLCQPSNEQCLSFL
jgi:hypothetical protein